MTVIKLLNDNEFNESFKLIKSVFEIYKNISNQVFKKQFSSFMFEEFDWAMSADFWNSFLKPMGVISQDDRILMAVLDPDPLNYFYNEFGYYNFVKFPINISGNKYFEILEQRELDIRNYKNIFLNVIARNEAIHSINKFHIYYL